MPRRAARLLPLAAVVALAAGACVGAASSAAPATPTAAPATAPAVATPTSRPSTAAASPGPGTIATAWGTAWGALPKGFPVPARAEPAEPGDPTAGPVSGAFVASGTVDVVAREMQRGLVAAGYTTEALSGPAEDGSLVIDSVGRDPACRVQATVRPLGTTTMITVLFGAACPWH